MTWRFEATTLGHVAQGEIENAKARSVTTAMRKSGSATFRTPFNHPLAEAFMSGDCLVQAFDDREVCMFNGPVINAQEDSTEGSAQIVVTAYDPTYDLTDRMCGKSATGFSMGTAVAPVDAIAIAKAVVDGTNLESETGIDTTGMNGVSAKTYVGPLFFKQILPLINELANTLDGFDWTVIPQRQQSGKIAVLSAAGAFGTVNRDAAFEFGDGLLNVASYQRTKDRAGMLNSGWSLPPGFPDNATQSIIAPDVLAGTADATSIALRGLHEGVISGDLSVDALRLKQVQEHVRLRRTPRELITFTPTSYLGNTPVFGVDFSLGDAIPFRATVEGVKRVDVLTRCFAVTHSLDDDTSVATPSITIVND